MFKFLQIIFFLMCPLSALANYQYCAPLTPTAASGATQTDFTEVFTGNNALFKAYPTGAIRNTTTRNGITVPVDFILTTDSTGGAGTIAFKWDFEDGGTVTGTPIVHVKFPGATLTTSPPTVYGCFGDIGVTSYQGGSIGDAYDANTLEIAYFPGGAATDFSANSLGTTTATATSATGKIGGAAGYGGTSSTEIIKPSAAVLNPATGVTVSVWINTTTTATQRVMGKGLCGTNDPQYQLAIGSTFTGSVNTKPAFTVSTARFTTMSASDSVAIPTNTWVNLVGTFDGSNIRLYVNSALVSTVAFAGSLFTSSDPLDIGLDSGCTTGRWFFNGAIDHLRIDGGSTVRDQNWINTAYNNHTSLPVFGTPIALVSQTSSQSFVF